MYLLFPQKLKANDLEVFIYLFIQELFSDFAMPHAAVHVSLISSWQHVSLTL